MCVVAYTKAAKYCSGKRWPQGVGHDHVHDEALTEIILLNKALLTHETHYNDCTIITSDHYNYWCQSHDH